MKHRRILAIGLSGNARMRGVERVVFESLKAVSLLNSDGAVALEIVLLAGQWQTYYQPLVKYGIRIHSVDFPNRLIYRHLFCWFVVPWLSRRYDVVHLFNTLPLSASGAGRTIVTIHDLAEFARPDKYGILQAAYRRMVVRYVTRIADVILTVSTFSQRQIEHFLPSTKVLVVPNGVDHLSPVANLAMHIDGDPESTSVLPSPAGLSSPPLDSTPYFLSYGVIERTKGLDRALTGFERMKMAFPDCPHRFIIVGEKGNLFDEIEPFLSRSDVVYLGFVDDDVIARLIRGATAVVFLSEYEGFGFPPLEAISLGVCVIVSRDTVLDELCSPYCLTADPLNVDEIATALTIASQGRLPWSPVSAAVSIRERLSWASAAQIIAELYQSE
ncbi:MAG: glycosyltransferase family 4 protein [Candidatus Accumulibacter sp.]|uniref:glycosyltransferase family 4 protein n=1 Tax=Accumulibacter sp. TaxID=2053492 RepID=UPI001AC3C7EE|nr:glycosyltransferase family 1 protein [Accumulibacter sp.]MBN8438404.1 glycosyltransferase family 4 protein [Accumulibacter sp.]